MVASNMSGGSDDGCGEESRNARDSSSADVSKVNIYKPEITQNNEVMPSRDDSLASSPKESAETKGSVSQSACESNQESTMDYTPSPSSDNVGSANASPKAQVSKPPPVVSHIPASVQQPILPASEQSSLASPAPHNYGVQQVVDGEHVPTGQNQPQQMQQPQTVQESKVPSTSVPTFHVVHGTQGQVVKKQKGRFRLLQNAPIASDADSDNANTTLPTAGGGDVPAPAPVPIPVPVPDAVPVQLPAVVTTFEGGLPPTSHPSRERTLSNTSTLSAKSLQNPTIVAPAIAVASPNVLQADSPAKAAPVVKKKGRFVVIPGDVADPSLLGRVPRDGGSVRQITPTGQPFPAQLQHVHEQTMQPMPVTEQVGGSVAQPNVGSLVSIPPHDSMQQTQIGDSYQYQRPVNAQSIAGSVQYQQQQPVAGLQFYQAAPQGTPQAVQVSIPQQQQVLSNVSGVSQLQTQTSSPPIPPPPPNQPSQPYSQQQNFQAPAQVLVSEAPPTYLVGTEDGRLHQAAAPQLMIAGQQHMVSIPEHGGISGVATQPISVQQATPIPHHPQSFQTPQTSIAVDSAPKVSQATKPAALKKPAIQRSGTSGKGAATNVGFGKVLYFLEQMKLEVTEADRTIKNQARDMKFLREKNKELEARSREMERKWLEEKTAREALEAKVKSLRKKVKEQTGCTAAHDGGKLKETDGVKPKEISQPPEAESRNGSIDETANGLEKTATNASETTQTGESQPASRTLTTELGKSPTVEEGTSKPRSEHTSDANPSTHPRVNELSDSAAHMKASLPTKESTSSTAHEHESLQRSSSGDVHEHKYAKTIKQEPDSSSAANCRRESNPGVQGEKPSPPRRRVSGTDASTEKAAAAKSSARSFKSQTVPTIAGPVVGHGGINAAATISGDSFGSSSEFDPLRIGHSNAHDGATSTTSEPLPPGQTRLSSGNSVVSFVTAPASAQTVDFDPLSVGQQSHKMIDEPVPSMVIGSMQPAHNQSQSMPNFVLHPSSMMMAYPIQRVDMHMANSSSLSQLNQSWNPRRQQQSAPIQSQYLPSQYASIKAPSNLQPQNQYSGVQSQVVVQKSGLDQSSADPFDELASRRAPGIATARQCGSEQQQQQVQDNWTNQSS